jgi:ParB family chromosome partitioning protein
MASRKLFEGRNLADIAASVKENASPSPFEKPGAARPVMPAAELALSGPRAPALERENIFLVDPKRCRPWVHHNRSAAWYTRERCADLIESMPRDGQQEPALARRLTGDPQHDFELIYGLRRRYAAELAGLKLRVRVTEVDDRRAAILMHAENADRADITPMERARSFHSQIRAGLFATQDALAEAFGVSSGQVAKMVRAAELLEHPSLAKLFPDLTQVPVEQAYKLASLMERPGARDVVLQAAQNLAKRENRPRDAGAVLRHLLASLDRSRSFPPVRKTFNVGASGRMIVTRNPKGKVTLAFPLGVDLEQDEAVLEAVRQALKEVR